MDFIFKLGLSVVPLGEPLPPLLPLLRVEKVGVNRVLWIWGVNPVVLRCLLADGTFDALKGTFVISVGRIGVGGPEGMRDGPAWGGPVEDRTIAAGPTILASGRYKYAPRR